MPAYRLLSKRSYWTGQGQEALNITTAPRGSHEQHLAFREQDGVFATDVENRIEAATERYYRHAVPASLGLKTGLSCLTLHQSEVAKHSYAKSIDRRYTAKIQPWEIIDGQSPSTTNYPGYRPWP